jgi:hypothetical protein
VKRTLLGHLSDDELLRQADAVFAQERRNLAGLLASLAEFDHRGLYAPAGYSSTRDFCVGELGMDEDEVDERITAARLARRFPVIFEMIADGRLHTAAVVMLAPHLTGNNATELLAAATHKSESEIEQLLAERFGRAADADRGSRQ